jgi:dTDP-4-dehydrorhamnose reductase
VGGALLPLLRHSQEVLAPDRAEFDLSNPNALAATLDRLDVDLIINPSAHAITTKDFPTKAIRPANSRLGRGGRGRTAEGETRPGQPVVIPPWR